ncbi:hypothetical protein [Sulfurimonas sp.]
MKDKSIIKEEPIISVLNLKSGVGCSTLVWNIAHILDLNIYQHDKAIHNYFLKQREASIQNGNLFCNKISVNNINKKKFLKGVYDLGSDFNYKYVRQILKKSTVIIVPIEPGYEVLLKSIATIKFIQKHNQDSKIFIVFNRLDSSNTKREKKYSAYAEDLILEHIKNKNIMFLHIRQSLAIYKNLSEGFYFLDNYIKQDIEFKPITSFNLLRNLRWYSIKTMLDSKRINKAEQEMEETDFFDKHKKFFEYYTKNTSIEKVYDSKFNDNNRRLIKDMLILTTFLRDQYLPRWDYTYE